MDFDVIFVGSVEAEINNNNNIVCWEWWWCVRFYFIDSAGFILLCLVLDVIFCGIFSEKEAEINNNNNNNNYIAKGGFGFMK